MANQQYVVKSPWGAYLGLLFGSFTMIEAMSFQIPALPVLTKTFGVSVASAGLFSLCYYLTHIVFGPVFGHLADQHGRKQVVLFGMIVFAISEFLAAMCTSFPLFLLTRAVQGIGSACVVPAGIAYASYLFTEERRGLALGTFSAIGTVGAAFGGILGGFVISNFGWQSIYIISGALAILGAVLVKLSLPETPCIDKQPFDYIGSFLFLLAIGALLSVNALAVNEGIGSLYTLCALGLGLITLVLFFLNEKRCEYPFLELSLLKNPIFIMPLILYFFIQVCNSSVLYTNAFFVSYRPGGSAQLVGTLTTYIYIAGAITGLLGGKLVDLVDMKKVIIFSVTVFFAGALAYTQYTVDTPFWYIVLTVVIFTGSICMMMPACMKMALAAVSQQKLGAGSGTYTMIQYMGNPTGHTIGLAAFGALSASALNDELTVLMQKLGINAELITQLIQARKNGNQEIAPILAEQLNSMGLSFSELLAQANLAGMIHALNLMSYGIVAVCAILLLLGFVFLPHMVSNDKK